MLVYQRVRPFFLGRGALGKPKGCFCKKILAGTTTTTTAALRTCSPRPVNLEVFCRRFVGVFAH